VFNTNFTKLQQHE